jgi:hypothetical protein
VEVADNAGLDNRLIILPVDAFEVEDAAVLLHELGQLARRFKRLRLGCRVDPSELDATTLGQLRKSLDKLDIRLTARAENEADREACSKAGIAVLELPEDAMARPVEDFV